MLQLREVRGLPDPGLRPPVVAEPGDSFARLRVVHLLARVPRGVPVRLRDVVDQLNAEYVDWSFDRRVVVDAVLQLQANWMTDYRNSDGIVVVTGAYGETVTIEDSSRVDPWMVGQVERLAGECRKQLLAFARDEGGIP